jgi:hypothetical protein
MRYERKAIEALVRYLCTFPLLFLSDSSYQRKWVGGECVGTCASSGLDGKGGTGCPLLATPWVPEY